MTRSRSPLIRARSARRLGYTVVEVMMSLGVLTLGAAGVIGLQKVTLAANTNARNLTTASAIAQSWVERLRVDALQWNNPNTPDVSDTTWLKMVSNNPGWCAGGGQTNKGWQIASYSALAAASPEADVLGSNVYTGDTAASAFCTHLRFTQLGPKLMRAEIRVFWERAGQPVDCTADPTTIGSDTGRYGFVYVTTSVAQNTAPF